MDKIREILDDCESLDQAEQEILELIESLIPPKMSDRRGRYWNECRGEFRKRLEELRK